MPIKFRCKHCQQFLGISRAKAGIVTDCPACGRSIRVPNLDGTVAPLPSPKLNLDDTDLRDALGALASLEAGMVDEVEAAEPISIQTAAQAVEIASDADIPVVVAEPVSGEVHVSAEEFEKTSETNDNLLLELAQQGFAQGERAAIEQTNSNGIAAWKLLVSAVVLFATGMLFGRLMPQQQQDSEGKQEEKQVAPGPLVARNPVKVIDNGDEDRVPKGNKEVAAVTGQLTYINESGEVLADRGARVLVLPKMRKGTSMLSHDGFQIGADAVDQALLAASVDALGGKFALADDAGEFDVAGLADGDYVAILGSKFCPREAAMKLTSSAEAVLGEYFRQPNRVIGQVEYHLVDIRINQGEIVRLDHEFQRR